MKLTYKWKSDQICLPWWSLNGWNMKTYLTLKVPYYEKHVFSGLYIYKLVLPEPANSQNEENKRFLHGLCSPPTGKTVLLQAVQIQLLSLR